ncbi:MAG: glycoside hydrolase family 3 N-terminal domain-containing protein, partial [Clostridium sp.]
VVVTDAMDMAAITNYYNEVEATLLALDAGCDIILMPYTVRGDEESLKGFEEYFNGVVAGIKEGKVSEERLDDAVTRIVELKIKRGLIGGEKKEKSDLQNNALKVVGNKEYKAVEREIAKKSVTVMKNEGDMLPLKLDNGSKVVIVDYYSILPFGMGVANYGGSAVEASLEKIKMEQRFPKMKVEKASIIYEPNEKGDFILQTRIDEIKTKIDGADYVVFAPYQFDTGAVYAPGMYLPSNAKAMIEDLINYSNEKDKKYAYLSVKDPYDIAYLPKLKNAVACYANVGGDIVSGIGYRETANIDAAVRAIFGLEDTTGVLPVDIKKANDDNIVIKSGTGIKLNKITEGYIYNTDKVEEGITPINIALVGAIILLLGVAIVVSKKQINDAK